MAGGRLAGAWGPRGQALAIVAILAVAGGVLVARSGRPAREASRAATSTVPATTLTTPPSTAVADVPATSTTTRTASTSTTGPATTTTVACRNSTSPACGPFRWDPAPAANQPMRLSVSVTPSQPQVGQRVTFQVVAEDPDGQILGERVDFGGAMGPAISAAPACAAAHGPWTPPKGVPGKLEKTYEHTYPAAGSVTATFNYRSYGPCPDPSIYASDSQLTVPLVIAPAS